MKHKGLGKGWGVVNKPETSLAKALRRRVRASIETRLRNVVSPAKVRSTSRSIFSASADGPARTSAMYSSAATVRTPSSAFHTSPRVVACRVSRTTAHASSSGMPCSAISFRSACVGVRCASRSAARIASFGTPSASSTARYVASTSASLIPPLPAPNNGLGASVILPLFLFFFTKTQKKKEKRHTLVSLFFSLKLTPSNCLYCFFTSCAEVGCSLLPRRRHCSSHHDHDHHHRHRRHHRHRHPLEKEER